MIMLPQPQRTVGEVLPALQSRALNPEFLAGRLREEFWRGFWWAAWLGVAVGVWAGWLAARASQAGP